MTSPARTLSLAIAAALALAAGAVRAADPAPAGCTGTLSGAVTGTFKCGVLVRDLEDGTAVLEIKLVEKPDTLDAFFPGNWILPGGPKVQAYPFEVLGHGRSSLIVVEGGTLYSAQRSSSERGEVTIVLTRVTPQKTKPATWAVGGSLRATLPPAASLNKKAPIVLDVRF